MDNMDSGYHAGYVALVGRPNVGKSTMINAMLGQKIAAVSPRPQTTRRTQLAILTLDHAQVVFIDTPGLHKPVHKLGQFMNEAAESTLEETDLILWVVDASMPPHEEDRIVADRLAAIQNRPKTWLILNKIDLLGSEQLEKRTIEYSLLLPTVRPFGISAATGLNCMTLAELLAEELPEGVPLFSEDQVTDLYEREIATELLREAALLHLRDEVPHAIAVRIDEYKERGEQGAYISATLLVERDSHKGMVIGRGGEMLKKIGVTARAEIEKMSGRKIFLELRVKVNKNWRNNPSALRTLGYNIEKTKK